MTLRFLLGGLLAASAALAADPYAWLEPIDGARPMAWVRKQNEATARRLESLPDYAGLYRDALGVLDNATRIPVVEPHERYLYNLWRDSAHPRGLYRRTTLEEFCQDDPAWQPVIDFDALSKKEGKPWSMEGVVWREPDERRALVRLSYAGGDARETREFDVGSLRFVPDGFVLPVAKSQVSWAGEDELLVGTDFGPGTMSASGYPLIIKLWRRGEPLASARTLRVGAPSSTGMTLQRYTSGSDAITVVSEDLNFYRHHFWRYADGALTKLRLPERTQIVGDFHGRLVCIIKDPWVVRGFEVPAGSLLVGDQVALREDPQFVLQAARVVQDGILVTALHDVNGRMSRLVPMSQGWRREEIPLPDHGMPTFVGTDDESGDAWLSFETFLTPPALYRVPGGQTEPEKVKQQEPSFDGSRFETTQLWATSADGTRIPYFVVGPKHLKHDGSNPVWMFAYGGFENSVTPAYSGSYEENNGAYGKLWLERGGVFVLANLRGGGEFGPQWHDAVLRENHYKVFEDFEAVARDIEARGITSPAHLGIEGRSNGGLLVASAMLRHPELYGAAVCGNPLLDMKRYSHLLAGASWMAEYGNPDVPAQWAYISKYSPYQNVRPGMRLPPILFYTTTRDDRVHPSHARKMAAKMEAMGYAVDYLENTEGGHHGSVTHAELARRLASTYAFLWAHVR